MGSKDSGSSSNPSADALARISQDFYNQTSPLRQAFIERLGGQFGIQPQMQGAPGAGATFDDDAFMRAVWDVSANQKSPWDQGWTGDPMVTPDNPLYGLTEREFQRQLAQSPNPERYRQVYLDQLKSAAPDWLKYQFYRTTANTPPPTSVTAAPAPAPAAAPVAATAAPVAPAASAPSSAIDPTKSVLFPSLKDAIESQYTIAKQNLISSSPAGGALTTNLANLENQRAKSMTAALGDIGRQEYNTALQLATGGAAQGMSGLGSAAAIQAQMQAASDARQAQSKQGLGQGVGFMAGSYLGGPGGAALASRK